MAEQSAPNVGEPATRIRRPMTTAGCLPVAIGASVLLLIFLNLVTYVRAPLWILDVREWRIAGRLAVSTAVLAALQLIATWVLGLMGAIGGAQAYDEGGDVQHAQRQLIGPALAVVSLRLLLLGVVVVGLGLVVAGLFDPDVDGWHLLRLFQFAPKYAMIVLPCVGIIGLTTIAGPFLRARYSVALGLWAAGWPERAAERPWVAVSARLGAGFAGLFGLMWTATLVLLAWVSVTNPILDGQGLTGLQILPNAPSPLASAITWLVAVGLIAGLVLAGQVILPWVYRRLARRRMALAAQSK